CDDLSLAKQNEAIRKLQLPVATLTYSGAKSIHAIVKIDAANAEEYRQRVEFLYKICEKNGLTIDTANKNPSRLSRLPGIKRGGKKQFLIGTNLGKESWNEWREWIENTNDDMPFIKNLGEAKDKGLPPKADELIHGVLRQGHKMLIAGPSKAGKSFALIELAMAIASGTTWLGHFP
ncbi:AAA family ATPase, partial [Acidaminococcus intestini]